MASLLHVQNLPQLKSMFCNVACDESMLNIIQSNSLNNMQNESHDNTKYNNVPPRRPAAVTVPFSTGQNHFIVDDLAVFVERKSTDSTSTIFHIRDIQPSALVLWSIVNKRRGTIGPNVKISHALSAITVDHRLTREGKDSGR